MQHIASNVKNNLKDPNIDIY